MSPSRSPHTAQSAETDVLAALTAKCAKCGKCRSVCPVFAEMDDERFVARGRIALLDAVIAGELGASPKLIESLQACVGCYRCEAECPSAVDFSSILREFKSSRRYPTPIWARFVFRHVLPRRRLFDMAIKAGALSQKILPRDRTMPLRHLPMLLLKGRKIPELASRSFLRQVSSTKQDKPVSQPKMRAAFFVGCLTNYVYPQVAMASMRLLRRANIEVIVPPDQVCCGAPALALGDETAARKLMRANVEAFMKHDPDVIFTACASCGRVLKKEFTDVLGADAERFSSRVRDISELLVDEFQEVSAAVTQTVTYHDPCHLRYVQGIYKGPRDLLARHSDYREMPGADLCCGLGGLFNLYYYELSQEIAKRKARSIESVDADTVATSCPGCMLQLQTIVSDMAKPRRVVHLVEVLERAISASSNSVETAAGASETSESETVNAAAHAEP